MDAGFSHELLLSQDGTFRLYSSYFSAWPWKLKTKFEFTSQPKKITSQNSIN